MSLPRPRVLPGTAILFAVLSAVFLLELARGAVGDDVRLLGLGALSDSAPLGPDYWRLVTFGFLHSGVIHLALNLVLLLVAGPPVERRAGPFWLLAVFLAASVASGVGIAVKHQIWPIPGVTVGASGGMFGLLGAALVLASRSPARSRWARPLLALVLAAGLAYSLLPGVSMTGHLVGLALGAVIAALIPLRSRR